MKVNITYKGYTPTTEQKNLYNKLKTYTSFYLFKYIFYLLNNLV